MTSNAYLSQVIWDNSTIGVPLDTISIVISKYNGSVLTSTSTVYGDLASLSSMALPQAIAIQAEIQDQVKIDDNLIDYPSFAAYVLEDTTNETGVTLLKLYFGPQSRGRVIRITQ